MIWFFCQCDNDWNLLGSGQTLLSSCAELNSIECGARATLERRLCQTSLLIVFLLIRSSYHHRNYFVGD